MPVTFSNTHRVPKYLEHALAFDDYHGRETAISVTTLIGPPQIPYLKGTRFYTVDVTSRANLMYGMAIHAWIAEANKGKPGYVEERFSTAIGGSVLTGKPDYILGTELRDIKTIKDSAVSYGVKDEVDAWLSDKGANYSIEIRYPERVRCEHYYCEVRDVCEQYETFKRETTSPG